MAGIKECCTKEENLVVTEQKEDVIVRKCKVCGCRHFEVTADPIRLYEKMPT